MAPKLDRVIIQGVFRPAESISDVRVKIRGIIFIGYCILVSCVKFKFTFDIDASFIYLKFTKKILQLKFAAAFTSQPDSGTLQDHAYRDQHPRKHSPHTAQFAHAMIDAIQNVTTTITTPPKLTISYRHASRVDNRAGSN